MKILFIGNSYTYYNDLPAMFEQLCRENGMDVQVYSVTKGARKLCEFLTKRDEYTLALEELAARETFDVCFLQEQSILPIVDYGMFLDGVLGIMRKLKPVVGKFVLYETWARKEGHKTLQEQNWTVDYMTEELTSAYQSAGEAAQVGLGVDVAVSHVGLRFAEVREADPTIEVYDQDKTHPSYYGTALATLTHYMTLFAKFPDSTDVFGIPKQVCKVYREVLT